MRARVKQFGIILLVAALPWACSNHPASLPDSPICPPQGRYLGKPPLRDVNVPVIDSSLALEPAFEPVLTEALNGVIERALQRSDAPAITAAIVVPGRGRWSRTAGFASLQPLQAADAATPFHWASIGKTFTAVTVLRLVERGVLRLDDRLSTWFASYPNAQNITIEELLTHTAGVYRDNYAHSAPGAYITPTDSIEFAAQQKPPACPGEQWRYSNLGYVLLGQISERVSAQPFHQLIQNEWLTPLAMTQTQSLAPQQIPNVYAVGHINQIPDRDFAPSMPYAAGNIVTTADDMLTFWRALLSEQLLSPAMTKSMWSSLYVMDDPGLFYGRGIMWFEHDDQPRPVRWLGHAGGTRSSNAVVFYDRESGALIAVAINGTLSAVAVANQLRKTTIQFIQGQSP